MKKVLSLLLVFCMIATSCMFFVSCSKVDEKDFEKDPQKALTEAMNNTYKDFFSDDADMGKVLAKAFEKGSLTLSFESDDLMGGDLTKISETIYMDSENMKYVSDTSVTYNDEEYGALIFLDKTGLALQSEALFGNQTTLAVNLATFIEKFGDSTTAELFGIDEASAAEITEAVAKIKDAYEKAFIQDEEAVTDLYNEIYEMLNITVATEKLKLDDGKSVNCVVLSYDITNQVCEDVIAKMLDELQLDAEMDQEVKDAMDEMFAEINSAIDISLTEKIYVDQKTNKTIKMTLEGDITSKEEVDGKVSVLVALNFGENEITLSADLEKDDESVSADAKLVKEEADGKTVYKLTVDVAEGSATVNVFNASYSYEKKSGDIVLDADIYSEEDDDRIEIKVNGNIAVTKDEAKVEITSLTYGSITVNFKAILSFKALDEIPALPSDTKDIVDLTQGEWVDIINGIQQSPLGQLLFGIQE